ncbi:uncharacterized protein LOC124264207 [Haliotis rubra]|uniref:uncharacterized protein LOC124264207 n=1 Tax=Haliotis rubra TaxID=36100 RepID=UPI001EE58DC2|nr:uncharacterized protein LOC124264207 [Haliotis rubra]
MKIVYRILASQYYPLGYLCPYTSRAKILVQELWKSNHNWDEPIKKEEIKSSWLQWENELPSLSQITLPRCYNPVDVNTSTVTRALHVFCDASERIYGSVAYLRSEDNDSNVYVSFVAARSRVTPKKQLSMPRLELCAALSGAQLADTLLRELNLPVTTLTLWSDSTTVLSWLHSDSCRYKVFVGTRILEIQTLTEVNQWHYVNRAENPADDLTHDKQLTELSDGSRWRDGPSFLSNPSEYWPTNLSTNPSVPAEDPTVLKKSSYTTELNAFWLN